MSQGNVGNASLTFIKNNETQTVIEDDTTPANNAPLPVGIFGSVPLPAGAATSANQLTEISILSTIDTNTSGSATAANQVLEIAQLDAINSNTIGISTAANQTTEISLLTGIEANQTNGTQVTSVNNFPATQPVSGTVTVVQPTGSNLHADIDNFPATQAISAVSLPLPTGAATSANQTNGNQITQVSNFPATQPVSGTVTVQQSTGSNLHVDVDSSALPTGAATAALQTTGNTALGTINSTLGSPFQAGGSIGNTSFAATQATASNLNATVVTTGGAEIATNAGLTTINSTLGSPMQQTGGTVTVTQSTASNLETNANLHDGSGTSVNVGQKVSASSLPVVIASDQSAIPITGSITATNPSVGATGSAVPADATMVGGTDGTDLRALSVNSSGVLALPQGASTSALQTTGNSSLSTIASQTANLPASLGQKTSANSLPVVVASDQSAIPVTISGGSTSPVYRFSSFWLSSGTWVVPTGVTEVILLGSGGGGGGGGGGATGGISPTAGGSGSNGNNTTFSGDSTTTKTFFGGAAGGGGGVGAGGNSALNWQINSSTNPFMANGNSYGFLTLPSTLATGNGGTGGGTLSTLIRAQVTAGDTYTITIGAGGGGGSGGTGGSTSGTAGTAGAQGFLMVMWDNAAQ